MGKQIERMTKPEPSDSLWQKNLCHPAFLSACLALITFLAYLPTLRNEFVNYDDPDYVASNSHVQSGLSWDNVKWAFTAGHASNWHPLTWISHMIDCQLFEQNAGW